MELKQTKLMLNKNPTKYPTLKKYSKCKQNKYAKTQYI